MRNIEIKAKIASIEALMDKMKELQNYEYTVIKQHDTFFKSATGRLKLREFEDGTGQIIYYERPDIEGPKLSSYKIVELNVDMSKELKSILIHSNGIFGIIKKKRYLYMIGQTRVHIDEVDGLGNFVEFEVVLSDDQTIEMGEKIAEELMTMLDIKKENLISEAYVDLLH